MQLLGRHQLLTFKKLQYFGSDLEPIFSQIMINVSANLIDADPAHYSEHKRDLWLRLSLLFVPMLLRFNASINILKPRIRLFNLKQWVVLLDDLRKDLLQPARVSKDLKKKYKPSRADPHSLDSRYRRAHAHMTEDGDISKAYKAIVCPQSYTAPTQESVAYLRSLHPRQDAVNAVPAALRNYVAPNAILPPFTSKNLFAAIQKLKNGRQPGIDGLRKEHLISMAKNGAAPWLAGLAALATAISSAKVPTWYTTVISSTRLVGLPKPGQPNKRRPIGIGSTWLKVIDNSILTSLDSRIRPLLEPFQYGLAKAGPESLVQNINTTLLENESWVVLKLYVTNAFNTLNRRVIFEQVRDLFPELLPYINLLYGGHRECWTRDETGSHQIIRSEEGVTQGHTLGTVLFNVSTYRPVLLRLNKLLNPTDTESFGRALALHDDHFLLMDPAHLTAIWPDILALFSAVGLAVNFGHDKSTLYIPPALDVTPTLLDSLPPELEVTRDGLIAIGVPLGTDAYCQEHWSAKLITPVEEAVSLVCPWPDKQKAFALYRLCINTKQNYCLRMTNPNSHFADALITRLQDLLRRGLMYITDQSLPSNQQPQEVIGARVWQQAVLPAKNGGCSILDPKLIHRPAYIAAQLSAVQAYLKVSKTLPLITVHNFNTTDQFINNSPNPTRQEVLDLIHPDLHLALAQFVAAVIPDAITTGQPLPHHTPHQTEEPMATNQSDDLSMNKLIHLSDKIKIQKYLTKIQYKSIINKINATWPVNDINRLNSASNEGAMLITTLPTVPEYCISGHGLYTQAICYRLNLPHSSTPTGTCLCGQPISHYHLTSVCTHNNLRISKHNAARDAIVLLARAAGYTAHGEKRLHHNSRRALDFLIDNFEHGKGMYGDISVIDVGQQKYNNRRINPGQAALDRENEKLDDYRDELAVLDSSMTPCIIETHGNWGIKFRTLFDFLTKRVLERRAGTHIVVNDSGTVRYWKTLIQMTYYRASCIAYHNRCENILIKRKTPACSRMDRALVQFPLNIDDNENYTLINAAFD
jgi:hypothetical protein